jgi:16S rRNA (guanine966-N2)-methyltransferase
MSKGFTDRIIAGKWGGRPLLLGKSEAVRPTRNRVRQAAFNLLTSRVEWRGAQVVDLCCGSGAWGLEAESRGATAVWMVDFDGRTARQNMQVLASNAVLIEDDVRTWKPQALLDVVMADPPYGSGLAQALLLRAAELGKPGSWWCVELGSHETIDAPGFDDVVVRDYGVSRVWVGRQV